MLAVGSAVNQVGQSSMALKNTWQILPHAWQEQPIKPDLPYHRFLVMLLCLTKNMIQQEMGATALQTVMLGDVPKASRIRKLAGMELQKFTKLVEVDANEAFITLLQTMSSKGGLQQLAPIFKDLGVDGTRAISVLNSLVSNVGKLKVTENAAQAYKEANSVTNEYNVQNTTANKL